MSCTGNCLPMLFLLILFFLTFLELSPLEQEKNRTGQSCKTINFLKFFICKPQYDICFGKPLDGVFQDLTLQHVKQDI